jgi:hypothetical protein
VGLTNLGSESETCVGSRVRLVGVFISFEKNNFYQLPFTPPLSGSPYRSFTMLEELGYLAISPTTMIVQLANTSIKYPEGIVENLLVNVRGSYVFADFMVLDTHEEMLLVLGQPFLRDVNARCWGQP